MIAEAARAGDRLSIAAFERAGRYIGIALANLVHIINPSAIVIGGGVSQSGELLFEPMHTAMAEGLLNPAYLENLTLTRAAFGDNVGLVGALALGRTRYPPKAQKHE
jgi:glucokinase